MYHETIYKAAKRDDQFKAALGEAGQKLPLFPDSLEKGVWAASYSGWILGRYGTAEYARREAQWKEDT